MNYKNFFWFLPFISFFIGYQIFSFVFLADTVQSPILVGKSLPVALQLLSEHNLNARLLAQKPDADLPEGTILAQIPEGGINMKTRQNVFLVTSKKPLALKAPGLVGCDKASCIKQAKQVGVRLKLFQVASDYPAGRCIAQMPAEGQVLEGKTLTSYIARSDSGLVIFPDLVGLTYGDACEFLNKHNFSFELYHTNRSKLDIVDQEALIIDQKPRGGSLTALSDKAAPISLYFQQ